MKNQSVDIIISGCGPTGAMLANLLGNCGISVAIFDKEKDIYPLPRAAVIDDDIARIFQSAGFIEEILAVSIPSKGYKFLDQERNSMFGFKRKSGNTDNGYPNSLLIRQPAIEKILRQGLTRFPNVQLYTEHEVHDVTQDDDRVQVSVKDLKTNTSRTITGKYLLASEGGRSFVRKSLGIELIDYQFDCPWLIVDVIANENVYLPEINQQYCTPSRPATFLNFGHNRYRWEIMLKEDESVEYAMDDQTIRYLLSNWVDSSKVEIERKVVYNFHALIAKEWKKGRVLLLGDSAHQMPPFLGQGMASGIRDAHNVAWKLQMVLHGLADESILESYQKERYPHVENIVKQAIEFGKIIQISDQKIADFRDNLFKFLNNIPNISTALHEIERGKSPIGHGIHDSENNPLLGLLFIQPEVQTITHKMVRLDDLLDSQFALIGLNQDPQQMIHSSKKVIFEKLNVKYVNVMTEDAQVEQMTSDTLVIKDRQNLLTQWFEKNQIDFVLLRPDHYIYGMYRSDQIDDLIQSLQQHLFLIQNV